MPTASILTIEPHRGGVPVLAQVLYRTVAEHGIDPHLVYVDTDKVPTDWRGLVGYFLRHWRPQWEERRGMRGLAIPRYPVSLLSTFWLPQWVAKRHLQADLRLVACGSPHFGAPFTRSSQPYVIWMAGMYADELAARAQAGDSWAAKTLNGPLWPRLQALESKVLRGAAAIIGISPYTVQRIAETHPDLTDRLHTVFIPVDTDLYTPPSSPPDPARPVLVMSARIRDPRKNTAMLFRMLARVRAARPEVRLVVTGDLPDDRIQAEVEQAGVADAVNFVGHQSRVGLRDHLQQAAVFVLTSNQEGLSVAVLEAMACGVPVVSTRSGGPEGVLVDGNTGYLVACDDDAAMAERVLHLLNAPQKRNEMGQAAAQFAHQSVSPAKIKQQLIAILSKVYPQHIPNLSQISFG